MRYKKRSAAIAALTAAAVVASSPGAWAAEVKGGLVKATKTSEWTTPSPDPSGIGYNVNTKRFLISDGEVEEMGIYKGVNLYEAETSGDLSGTAVTTPWSSEPTGIAVNPNGEIYVSDDDKRTVFVLDSLSDTTPGSVASSKFTAHGVDPDLEGVGYDSKRNEILVANGERGAGFWRVKPGADGKFGTGDDVVDPKILVGMHGAVDPEGIAYDAVRDTVVMVDGSSNKIYEMTATGALLNRIDISGMGMNAAAGIEVAPASNGSAARNYFIVDRGVDNNSDPNENDGVLYEVAANLGDASANQPPTANAGADQVIQTGATATLTGSGTDIETAAAQLKYAWTKQSGTGTVTFGSPSAATTTATFPGAGVYTLRLTVTDGGGLTAFDDVKVTVADAGAAVTVSIPVATSSDDAMEGSSTGGTFVDATSKQNALGNRATGAGVLYPVITGLRFTNIPVPQGGEIVSAKIQFKSDEATSGSANLTIKGEAADNPPTFGGSGNISSRTATQASVQWSPADWPTANVSGPDQLTPDLKAILQEIVNRTGWKANNAAVLMISGSGRRAAKAQDALNGAPVLVLEYKASGGTTPPPANTAPVVNAGADGEIKLPAKATLDGTVTDDGKPNPPAKVTTAWSKVSGPGTVTFGNAALVDTTAEFSAAGTYVLRLTANDGNANVTGLTASDDVTITVKPADTTTPPGGGGGGGGGGGTPSNTAPSVAAGADASVTLPGSARLDGTVTDDGRPAPYTTAWTKVSGPGTVTFGDATKVDTTASFSEAGVYTLRLTANDSALTGQDEVTITVKAGPTAPSEPEPVATKLTGAVTHPSILVGTRTTIRGSVSPTAADHLLRLQRWNGEKWRTVKTKRLAEATQAGYRFRVLAKASGVSRYRVVSPAQAGLARAVVGGKDLRIKAYRAAIKRVNPRADVVVVKNTGKVAFSTAGWWLVERRSGARVGLPDFTVRPGRVVRIHTGAGASGGRHLYLDTGEMWAPHGVAELRDARVRLADRLKY